MDTLIIEIHDYEDTDQMYIKSMKFNGETVKGMKFLNGKEWITIDGSYYYPYVANLMVEVALEENIKIILD